MISLLVLALEVFALTFIVGQAKITYPIRVRLDPGNKVDTPTVLARYSLLTLLECNACLGTWAGFAAYWLHLTPPSITSWWMSGLFFCATSLLLARLAGLDAE